MKFLTNTYDPKREDAEYHLSYIRGIPRDQQWRDYLIWLSDKCIARPKATNFYTVEQLEAMGMVGIYDLELDKLRDRELVNKDDRSSR